MTDDRQLLDDYVLWSNTEPDKSIDAFLAERKAEADARRVEEAVTRIGVLIDKWDKCTELTLGEATYALSRLQSILIDDRPTIDDSTLTERRTRLA